MSPDAPATVTIGSPPPLVSKPRAVPRARVVIVAEQALVGEAVRVALASRGIDGVIIPWEAEPLILVRRRIVGLKPRAGLIVGDLTTLAGRERAAAVVAQMRMRWLLLVIDPEGLEWGGLLVAGVAGIRATSIGLDDLVDTLGALMRGVQMMPRLERTRRVREWAQAEEQLRVTAAHMTELTPRELAVLGHLYEGMSVGAIADAAGVSTGTVRTQVKAVLRKLGVSSQLAAVASFRRVYSRIEDPPVPKVRPYFP